MEVKVIFLHGSKGISESSKKYIQMLKEAGYKVISPDHRKWCDNHKGMCKDYKSNAEEYIKKRREFQKIYKNTLDMRTKELKDILRRMKCDVYVVGISEGGIVTALLKSKKVKKKVIIGYPCERTYFTQRKVYEQCPILNIMGSKDQFFGRKRSVSSEVSKNDGYKINGIRKGGICVKGAKHDVMNTHEKKVKKHMLTFLKKTP